MQVTRNYCSNNFSEEKILGWCHVLVLFWPPKEAVVSSNSTHTCCSLVSPRRAFKLLQKTFLPMCRQVVTQCGVSDNKPCAFICRCATGTIHFWQNPVCKPCIGTSRLELTISLHSMFGSRQAPGPRSCQLGRKSHCTSLMPAFRCCRLTHPHTIMLTHSRFAQTRAGMAWRKTLLVSSSWLIPCGCEVNRSDTQTSCTELLLYLCWNRSASSSL